MTRHRARRFTDAEYAAFREELRAFRQAMQLSQKAAAVLIGAHEATWARWEQGVRRPPPHVAAGVRSLMGNLLTERTERERVRSAVAAHRERKAARG